MMKKKYIASVVALSLSATCAVTAAVQKTAPKKVSPVDSGHTRYSPLTEINPTNSKDLKPVWVYDTGTKGRGC